MRRAAIAISDMGTFRARAGYAVGSFLPYMFGGVALGQANIVRTASIFGTQVNRGRSSRSYRRAVL